MGYLLFGVDIRQKKHIAFKTKFQDVQVMFLTKCFRKGGSVQ